MLRKIIIALGSLAMLAATLAAPTVPQALAQTSPGLKLITDFRVTHSSDDKYPHVVAFGNEVYASGNADQSSAFVWSKAVTATGFPSPTELGAAGGKPDYSSTSIARGLDGSIYVAWVNQPSRTIYLRQRNPAGTWGAARIVDRDSSFPVTPEVSVSSTGQIFVAWRIPDSPIYYRRSSDGGVTWTPTVGVGDKNAFASLIGLAAGPNGAMGVTFTAGEGDNLQIFVGLWDGTSFAVERATNLGADYADSTISFGPTGKVYVAWRGSPILAVTRVFSMPSVMPPVVGPAHGSLVARFTVPLPSALTRWATCTLPGLRNLLARTWLITPSTLSMATLLARSPLGTVASSSMPVASAMFPTMRTTTSLLKSSQVRLRRCAIRCFKDT